MAGQKKVVAVVLFITCVFSCSARPLEPSILSPIGRRVHIAVQQDNVVEIKDHYKEKDTEKDDVMKSSTSRLDDVHYGRSDEQNPSSTDSVSAAPLKRMTLDVGEIYTDRPLFAMLPKGPVAPSGPSCNIRDECH